MSSSSCLPTICPERSHTVSRNVDAVRPSRRGLLVLAGFGQYRSRKLPVQFVKEVHGNVACRFPAAALCGSPAGDARMRFPSKFLDQRWEPGSLRIPHLSAGASKTRPRGQYRLSPGAQAVRVAQFRDVRFRCNRPVRAASSRSGASKLSFRVLSMIRVRFAPSPTGYLHIGGARTFIFNWLYARHQGGVVVLRIDDTDVERNTQTSLDSIYEGLHWLELGWDEFYRQSDRLDLHRQAAWAIFEKGLAYRDFTPASTALENPSGAWLFNPGMRELTREESDRRADAGEPFVLRFRVPRDSRARGRCIGLRLRDGEQGHRRPRGFRAAALERHADLSHGLLRRRCRSAHHPHPARPGTSGEHVQARADLRSARRRRRRRRLTCRC